jgi:hypothetical protein
MRHKVLIEPTRKSDEIRTQFSLSVLVQGAELLLTAATGRAMLG